MIIIKKSFKKITALAVIATIALTAVNASAMFIASPEMDAKEWAIAVICGLNYDKTRYEYTIRDGMPAIVKVNPDDPDDVAEENFGDFRYDNYHCSKQDFIDKLIEITNKNVADIKSFGSLNKSTIFDEPNNKDCYKCPGRALERAKGTFYQEYVYDYWKQYNEVYATVTGHNIPSVEAFFKAENIPLTGGAPAATPTPVPTVPPKAVEKLNAIKSETDMQNTLYVIDADGVLTLAINGEIVDFPDLQPFIDAANRTQIPVRALAETFGCDVNWDGRISTAIISNNNKLITIAIDSSLITVNGVDTEMDTTAMLKNERTCVPVRYIAEALGLTVRYEKV